MSDSPKAQERRAREYDTTYHRIPDWSPGDVIHADVDGTIVLDDGITTWNPTRASKYFAARWRAAESEREELEAALRAVMRGEKLPIPVWEYLYNNGALSQATKREGTEKVTHGRHCSCRACGAQDWSEPQLAPCGMHGSKCPPVYDPRGHAGEVVATKREALDPADLIIEPLPHRKSQGVGVWEASPGVRITHKPTGITVEGASEKSQLRNKEVALAALQERLSQATKREGDTDAD